MSLNATGGRETAVENDLKRSRARRVRPLPGLARRLADLAAQVEQLARTENERDDKDHERVRALLNSATGGGAEKLLRVSPVLTDEDREFMREKGWRV